MDKLKVGIVVDLDLLEHEGGAFSYCRTLLNGINDFAFDESIEIVNIICYDKEIPAVTFEKPVVFIKGRMTTSNGFKKKLTKLVKGNLKEKLKRSNFGQFIKYLFSFYSKSNNKLVERQLSENRIDIIYFLKPEYTYLNYPFITSHWDVRHKSTYPFPEVSMGGNYEITENYYVNILNKALLIFCESEAGREELKRYYAFNNSKLKVLPIFGKDKLDFRVPEEEANEALSLHNLKKCKFFIYPAQFWAIKNHYNLLYAFKDFKEKVGNNEFKLVFCGSDKGNLNYIKSVIRTLSLEQSVIITGFVSDELLYTFYTNAAALVMPTFLGPTNMPLIEAAHLGCPVLCSNLAGHKEIMGENALYFEAADPVSIEAALSKITSDDSYRSSLSATALHHIKQSKFNLDKSLRILNDALLEIKPVRKTWGFDFVD